MTEQPPGPPGNYPPPPPPPPPPGGGYPPPPPPPPPQGGGGYPTPPHQGGYPPQPQQGGYPPPPGGGYPPAPGQPYSIGDAFSWAWNKFSKNAVPLIVATLVYAVILGAIYGIFFGLAFAFAPSETTYTDMGYGYSYSYTNSSFGVLSYIMLAIGILLVLIVGFAIQSAYTSTLLEIANGQPVTIGSFFKPRNLGNVIVAGVIVGVATAIGYVLCVIPGIIVAFLTMFTFYVLLDRNMSPVDSIKESIAITRANVGNAILAWLISALIIGAGVAVCYVGVIVAGPVAALFLTYTYRKLSGGQVAPATP